MDEIELRKYIYDDRQKRWDELQKRLDEHSKQIRFVDIFINTIFCCFAILMITGVATLVHEVFDYIFNFCG